MFICLCGYIYIDWNAIALQPILYEFVYDSQGRSLIWADFGATPRTPASSLVTPQAPIT